MGLFSGLRGKGVDESIDIPTAVMLPMIAAMTADGDVDDDEVRQIRSICVWSPIYARNTKDQDTQIILRALNLVNDQGADAMCAKAAEVLSPALRQTAFCFAARIVFSDEHVGARERELLERMVAILGIGDERARQIIEVVSIMQHTPDA